MLAFTDLPDRVAPSQGLRESTRGAQTPGGAPHHPVHELRPTFAAGRLRRALCTASPTILHLGEHP